MDNFYQRICLFLVLYNLNYCVKSAFMGQEKESGLGCQVGFYGPLCEDKCHCKDADFCDQSTGVCPNGCLQNFNPPSCSKCIEGKFGENCNNTCHCLLGNADCDSESGKCKSGECVIGYEGDTCQELTGFPRIESFSVDEVYNVYQTTLISCSAEGNPMPNATFITNNLAFKEKYSSNEIDGSTTVEFVAGNLTGVFDIICVAANGHGEIIQTFNATFVEPPVLVQVPHIENQASNEISISWEKWTFGKDKGGYFSDEPKYLVVYRHIGIGDWINDGQNWQSETKTVVRNLTSDSDYEFAVRCKRNGDGGEGPVGPSIYAWTSCADPNDKGIPQNFTSQIISPSSVKLSWQRPKHEDLGCVLRGYVISYTSNESSPDAAKIIEVDAEETQQFVYGMQPQTKYFFYITAKTKHSKPPGYTRLVVDNSDYVPGPVANLTLQYEPSDASQLKLSWDSPSEISASDEEYLNYTVTVQLEQLKACNVFLDDFHHLVIISSKNKTVVVNELHPFSLYRVGVKAKSNAQSSEVIEITANFSEAAPSGKPTNISIEEDNFQSLTFSWLPLPCNQANGRVAYRYSLRQIRRANDKSLSRKKRAAEELLVENKETLEHNVTFDNLSTYSEYEFSVNAYTSVGNGPKTLVTKRTAGNDPLKLVNPPEVKEVSSNEIVVSWKPWVFFEDSGGLENDQPEYRVIYRLNDEEDWLEGDRRWQNETTATISNLSADTNYEIAIRVRSISDSSDGLTSPVYSVTTLCGLPNNNSAPQYLTAQSISSSSALITWMPPPHNSLSCAVSSYNLTYWPKEQLTLADTIVIFNSNQTQYQLNKLQNQTDYTVQLTAITKINTPSISAEVTFETLTFVEDEIPITVDIIGATEVRLNLSQYLKRTFSLDENSTYIVEAQLFLIKSCPDQRNTLLNVTSANFVWKNIAGDILLYNLQPYSSYNVTVFLQAAPDSQQYLSFAIVDTPEAKPSVAPYIVREMGKEPTSLTFNWDPIPCYLANGNLTFRYSLRQVLRRNSEGDAVMSESYLLKDEILSRTIQFLQLQIYTEYEFTVRGYTSAGEGPEISLFARTMDDVSLPPSVVLYKSTSTNLTLQIIPPNPIRGKVLSYELQIRSTERIPWLVRKLSLSPLQVFHTETGLLPFTPWIVQVRAKTRLQWSDWSSEITVYTEEGLSEAPALHVYSSDSTTIDLRWSKPNITNGILINYKVEYFYMDNSTFISWHRYETPDNYSTRDERTGFVAGSVYMVKVWAQNSVGFGEPGIATFTMAGRPEAGGRSLIIIASPPPAPTIIRYDYEYSAFDEIAMEISISAVDENYEFSPVYYEIVVLRTGTNKEINLNETLITDYKAALVDVNPYWIAARLSADLLPFGTKRDFVIGDKAIYGDYYNGPILRNNSYTVAIRVVGDGEVKISYLSPLAVEPASEEKGVLLGGCKILNISCVLFMILVIVIVITFWLCVAVIMLCKRKRKKKLSISEGSRKGSLTGRPNNLWPASPNPITDSNEVTVLTLLPCSNSSIQSGSSKTFNKNCNFFGPIYVKDLADYITQRATNPKIDFQEEYKQATRDKTKPWTVAKKPENLKKNRYGNILPYDMTRVRLEPHPGQPDTDYINASFIEGYDKPKLYIASQGPKENTFQDFWRMIWQENVSVIVMLTALVESRKKKCDQYWPNHSRLYGNVLVTLSSMEHLADIVIRRFELKTVEAAEVRDVTHYHYLDWSDFSLPPCITSILNLRRRVRDEVQKRASRSPIVVHCSGGAGRTGTFIAIDAMLNQAYEEDRVHIFRFVGAMWSARSNLIQNVDQYRFVYDAVLEALQSGDTKVICSRLPIYFRDICRTSECEPSDIAEQFNILNRLERRSSCFSCPDALNEENNRKNRNKDILPVEHSRVRLQSIYEPVFEEDEQAEELSPTKNDPYINAVLCDGLKVKGQFLVTHMPLDDTVQDFWRMIVLNRSSVIVMLNDCEFIDENVVPGQYWPNEGCIQYGPYQVEVVMFEELGMVTLRTLRVIDTRKIEDFIPLRVMQLQFLDWVPEKKIPVCVNSIVHLINIADVLKQKYGGPIAVHCQDGASRCGLFCAAHILKEQVETGEVDVFQTIKRLRRHRPQFITSMEQYQFCYEIALASVKPDEKNKEARFTTLV